MSHRLKLRDWAKDYGPGKDKDLPPRLQLIVDGTRGEQMSFFAKKAKISSSRVGEENKTRTNVDIVGPPVDPTIRKLEFEMRLRALDSSSSLRGKISPASAIHYNVSPKKIQSVSSLLSMGKERDSVSNRKEETGVYYRSPVQQSRIHEDLSKLTESRSLLTRMKDEFRSSTNNSFLGLHKNEIAGVSPLTKRTEPILTKNILVKQRQFPGNESASENGKRENLDQVKAEVYSRMVRPSRREAHPGGTLDNLFSILHHERSLGEQRDSASGVNRSRDRSHQESNRVLVTENKSDVGRYSTTGDFQRSAEDVRQNSSFQKPPSQHTFPSDLISLLRKRLAAYPKERLDAQQLEQINTLSEELIKIINARS